MLSLNIDTLTTLAYQTFDLDRLGHHGKLHWQRVNQRGLTLATITGASPRVITAFAYLHDACREDEHEDPLHGHRGAVHASTMALCGLLDLEEHEIVLLHDAIKHHSDGRLSDEATIATCWDSDRLDLWRCGMQPAARFLSTDAAKAMLKRELKLQLQGA
jgi:uncharacterized protein